MILTCTGVSFAHGGNDGQKGMGLIMLILIGAAPTAYALNRTMPDEQTPAFVQRPRPPKPCSRSHAGGAPPMTADAARKGVGDALRTKDLDRPEVFAALAHCPPTSPDRCRTTAPSVMCRPPRRRTCATTCI